MMWKNTWGLTHSHSRPKLTFFAGWLVDSEECGANKKIAEQLSGRGNEPNMELDRKVDLIVARWRKNY